MPLNLNLNIDYQSEDDVKKASKWVNYTLVDIRVVFILVYVYTTIVTLIETTATNEASTDSHSVDLFNITSNKDHLNKMVSNISNPVLWNCREHSVSKAYYKDLYGLLIGSFCTILATYVLIKVFFMLGQIFNQENLQKHFTILHEMAAVQQLINLFQNDPNNTWNNVKKHFTGITSANANDNAFYKTVYGWHKEDLGKNCTTISGLPNLKSESETKSCWQCLTECFWCPFQCYWGIIDYVSKESGFLKPRKEAKIYLIQVIPLAQVFILAFVLVFALTSYDVHPVACIAGPDDDQIHYDNKTQVVDLVFSGSVIRYQIAAGCIVLTALTVMSVFAVVFFFHTISRIEMINSDGNSETHQNNPTTTIN